VTLAGIQLGWLLSGAIIIEGVFAWPGVGTVALQAITSRDYNVIQGAVIVTTGIYLFILLLVDVSYTLLDPRTRGTVVRTTHLGVEV
jgi:peptide/nickel transport system permease protein